MIGQRFGGCIAQLGQAKTQICFNLGQRFGGSGAQLGQAFKKYTITLELGECLGRRIAQLRQAVEEEAPIIPGEDSRRFVPNRGKVVHFHWAALFMIGKKAFSDSQAQMFSAHGVATDLKADKMISSIAANQKHFWPSEMSVHQFEAACWMS